LENRPTDSVELVAQIDVNSGDESVIKEAKMQYLRIEETK
jgi:hypothetical protein